jgi:hypothetical protein
MNHQPFEDWLIAEKHLTVTEKHELDTHLRTCPDCTALTEVNLALHSTRVTPAPEGFVNRFQLRLETQRKEQRKRLFWGYFILAMGVMGVMAWLLWPVLALVSDSPSELVSSWLTHLVSLWVSIQAFGHTGSTLLKIIPGFIPSYVWPIAILALAGSSILWVASLVKFTKVPQGV